MSTLEEKIGYRFQEKERLMQALRHSSYANEIGEESYERLEFLGDSILGMIVAEFLFEKRPRLTEGELTRSRAALVCEESLVEVADRLGLGKEILLGRGEQARGARVSIRADVVEAILAAVYLDGGMVPAKQMVTQYILSKNPSDYSPNRDFKTALQEEVQKTPGGVVKYELVKDEGPDHAKIFFVEVFVGEKSMGEGTGKSKKEAEQQAAKIALSKL